MAVLDTVDALELAKTNYTDYSSYVEEEELILVYKMDAKVATREQFTGCT